MHLATRNKMDKKLEAVMADILNKGRLDYWSQVGQRSWAVAATIAWTEFHYYYWLRKCVCVA